MTNQTEQGAASLLTAGTLLSNVAFNLAQRGGEVLTEDMAQALKDAQRAWDHACVAFRAAALEAPNPTPEGCTSESQLHRFYGVATDADLIEAQAVHIERLQAKLPPTPSMAPQRVREG